MTNGCLVAQQIAKYLHDLSVDKKIHNTVTLHNKI